MNFAEAAKNETKWTTTENGAVALNTTSNPLLDFFSVVGSLRDADDERIFRLFDEAYANDKLFATKILFYARDIRGGVGERDTFRKILNYCANNHPEAIRHNITLIPEYGRWDDLYSLVGTPLEDEMWEYMRVRFVSDLALMEAGKPTSILAKWVKSADASSLNTKRLGIYTAKKLGYSVYDYKRKYKALRKYIDVTERKMSRNEWGAIDYEAVPSYCMLKHRNAFKKHDDKRFTEYAQKAVNGDVKIHSATLYPYDIIGKILSMDWWNRGVIKNNLSKTDLDVINAQWNQLPNYVEEGSNVVVIADTSGSMCCSGGRPLYSAVGLAIYFAQRNKGAFHNLWMNFSDKPHFNVIKGERLENIINSMNFDDWMGGTNLHAALSLVLDVAVKNNIPQNDMPKSIVIISDMEINQCTSKTWTFYDQMAEEFSEAGYQIPSIVFWNVESRHDIYHSDNTRKGVQLVSGQSTSVFKTLMSLVDLNPVEAMEMVINSDRYSHIIVK